ncbi:GNAT family N-acetyltransferase [Marilutibacter alkalisoli]|uniref:N-acetyltransferase n=1 Tax=Marilutibacter alkalisoli TaxID=2591633 RepID=A0A514BT73_9GAMM|nr:GNAT family N-acetyltransferase [Lysobacter alkalisoli]QDH70229.1 N-acetyltransferase [Lysobacter alkalisoli]
MTEQESPTPEIHHDVAVHRFATTVDGAKAYLDYQMDGRTMVVTHTWVPEPIGGRGIASRLVRAAFEYAREAGLKVRTQCSYAEAWSKRRPEYASLLV